MANITLSSGDYFRPYKNAYGFSAEIAYGQESTGQSYRYGQVLESDQAVSTASGKLAAASVSNSTVTSSAIIGIAAEPASSVQNTKRGYYPANAGQVFWGRTKNGTIESTNLFKSYGLAFDSTLGINLVDLGNTASTSERVIVVDLIDAAGDSGGAVAFKFGSANNSTVTFYGQRR